jgi:DNA-binding response OmpR family regulator
MMPNKSAARILVVDDDPLFLKSLCSVLRDDGHVVVAANGGEAGIEAFQSALNAQSPFVIVITDLGMHPVDGRQVASAVKTASPSTIVILLTGWGEWFKTKDAIPLPADCILGKPPKLDKLRATLTNYLGSARS